MEVTSILKEVSPEMIGEGSSFLKYAWNFPYTLFCFVLVGLIANDH